MNIRFSKSALPAALLAGMVLLAGTAAPLSAQNASVRVVHGIPGADVSPGLDPALPVDVLVNDAICLLDGFTFGSIAGPFTLPEGTYDIKISVANTLAPCSNDAVIAAPVPVAAGENVSIVAHLDEAGGLTATKFVNDVTPMGDGMARIIAHHLAAAPAVDVGIRGGFPPMTLTVPNVTNGAQAAAPIRAGGLSISIAPAGAKKGIFSTILRTRPGLSYTVYAVGSLANGTFALLSEPIGGLEGITVIR